MSEYSYKAYKVVKFKTYIVYAYKWTVVSERITSLFSKRALSWHTSEWSY